MIKRRIFMRFLAKTMFFGCFGLFGVKAVAFRLGGSLVDDLVNTREAVDRLKKIWEREELKVSVPKVTQALLRLLGGPELGDINIETVEDLEPIFSYISNKIDDHLDEKKDFSRDDISNLILEILNRLRILIESIETRIRQSEAIIEQWDKISESDKLESFEDSLETGDKNNLKVLFEKALAFAKDEVLEIIKKTPTVKHIKEKVNAEKGFIFELREQKEEIDNQIEALERQDDILLSIKRRLGY